MRKYIHLDIDARMVVVIVSPEDYLQLPEDPTQDKSSKASASAVDTCNVRVLLDPGLPTTNTGIRFKIHTCKQSTITASNATIRHRHDEEVLSQSLTPPSIIQQ